MNAKHSGARGICLGLLYVLAMIFVAPLRLSQAYEAAALVLPGQGGSAPLLALGTAALIPVGAFLGALPERMRRWRKGERGARSTARECLWGFLGGFALLLGAGLAGGGVSFLAFGEAAAGALSGYGAAALMLLAAYRAARLRGKGREAKP